MINKVEKLGYLFSFFPTQELVAQLRARIADLEGAAQQHQRQLAAARQHAEALESRLTTAELAAARSAAEVRLGRRCRRGRRCRVACLGRPDPLSCT